MTTTPLTGKPFIGFNDDVQIAGETMSLIHSGEREACSGLTFLWSQSGKIIGTSIIEPIHFDR